MNGHGKGDLAVWETNRSTIKIHWLERWLKKIAKRKGLDLEDLWGWGWGGVNQNVH